MAKVQLIARLHCWIIEEWLTDWIRRLMEWFVDLPLSSMSPLKPFLRYFPLWATSFFRYHLCCFHLHTYIPSSPSMRYFFLEQPFLWATSVCYKTSLPLPLVWAISPISHFLIASPSPHCLFFEATLLWIISLLFSENIFFSSRISLSSQFSYSLVGFFCELSLSSGISSSFSLPRPGDASTPSSSERTCELHLLWAGSGWGSLSYNIH